MSLLRRPLAGVTAVAAGLPLVWGGYLTAIGAAAQRALTTGDTVGPTPTGRGFRILVPAHDEEDSIADTLRSLTAMRSPGGTVEIHVVADNCTDRTAEVARALGATVHERHDPTRPGKGPALVWLLDRLPVHADDDAVVVVDADTVVDPDLLVAFDRALSNDVAVQGHYAVRDQTVDANVAFRAAALAVRHLVRPAGRTALGGSSSLHGNGMAFHESVARRYPWSDHLTEDLDLGLRLLLDGHRVGFAPAARVEAEMPTTFEAATSQHERWESGRSEVARHHGPALARAALRGDHGRRWPYLDALVDITMPPLTIAVGAAPVAAAASLVVNRGRARAVGVAASLTGGALAVAHVLHALRLAGAPDEVRRSLTRAPIHLAWKARLVLRTSRARPREWVRTTRTAEEAA